MSFMQKAREFSYALRVRVFGRQAVEAATEGWTARRAAAMDTVEGDIQIATQRDAWTTQIRRLEEVGNARNRDQEYLLRQLRRNVRDLDGLEARRHATPAGLGSQRLAAFGAVGQRRGFLGVAAAAPALSILLSPWTLLVAACAFALVQMGLKERIENQRDAALEAARENYEAAERWRERSEEYRQGLEDAANVAREAAAALEGERRRQSAAAARERRRNREIANVLAGSPEPPDWRLREPEPSEESGSAAPGP